MRARRQAGVLGQRLGERQVIVLGSERSENGHGELTIIVVATGFGRGVEPAAAGGAVVGIQHAQVSPD